MSKSMEIGCNSEARILSALGLGQVLRHHCKNYQEAAGRGVCEFRVQVEEGGGGAMFFFLRRREET